MSRALWLLLGLQLRGWLRNAGRGLGTVKGAALAVVGLGVFTVWMGSLVLSTRTPSYTQEQIREWGPAVLLLYCLLNVLSASGERAVYFSPGEVNFLFTGPFGRRELLAYKLVFGFLFGLPTTLFMTFVFQIYARSFLAAFVGLLLTYQFMNLFVTAVKLAASAVEARLYSFGRRAAAAAAVALAAGIAWQAGLLSHEGNVGDLMQKAIHTDVWRTASLPLRYYFDAFLSERLWPDLAWNAALALAVDAALVGLIFGLDANYLEASAAASARIYARLQRVRRVGPSAAHGGRVLFSLPMPPSWGGAGPILWRQLTTATRGATRLLLALTVFAVGMVAAWSAVQDESRTVALPALVGMGGLMMTFLTTLAPFDFRGDVDQMAVLKTLPIAPWRLALGELLAPVLIFTLIQWAALAAMRLLSGRPEPLLLAAAAFAPLYNFILFGVENILFLLFPTRVMVTTPGDFQAMGRYVLAQFAKVAGLGGAAVVATVAGVVAWWASGFNVWAGTAAAWAAAALFASLLVPLMGWAFRGYDVGRDAPP